LINNFFSAPYKDVLIHCAACLAAGFMLATDPALAAAKDIAPSSDLAHLPLEQLLDMEYVPASKMARQITDAPSAVSIVTADDIRAYGYRTLAEVFNSLLGLHTPYDGSIWTLGGRGFGRPGDYTGRVLLMIDGYATNDNIYDEAYIGNDGLLDVELIERVEYVPGSGSVIYGNNAFFGIINVFTKKGSAFNGTQVAGEVASHGGKKGRVTYGRQLENGANVLLSVSELNNDGRDFYFPEFNKSSAQNPNFAVNHGVVSNLDFERAPRVFGKLEFEGWTAEGGYVSHRHANPTANYDSVFNALAWDWDTNGFASVKLDSELSSHLKSATHVYYGYYLDRTVLTEQSTMRLLHEHNRGQWAGVDVKFVGDWFDHHKLVFGAEYRDDFEVRFLNDFGTSQYSRTVASLYGQDEISLTDKLKFNVGSRYDQSSSTGGHLSPRVALIYNPIAPTTIKVSFGSAYRQPSAYEQFYHDATAVTNPSLGPEYVTTTELVLVHQFSREMRFTGSVYHYQARDLISNVSLPSDSSKNININTGKSHTNGLELELERNWDNGVRLRGSYAWQQAIDAQGLDMVNSPNNLGKLNLTFPMLQNTVRTGFEVQATSARDTELRHNAAGYTVANLTFSSEKSYAGLRGSFSIRNLFDRQYVTVASSGMVQDTLQMDGRNFWLQVDYSFK